MDPGSGPRGPLPSPILTVQALHINSIFGGKFFSYNTQVMYKLPKPKFAQNFVSTPFFGRSFLHILHKPKNFVATTFLEGFFSYATQAKFCTKFVLKQSLKEIHSFAPSFNLRRAMR